VIIEGYGYPTTVVTSGGSATYSIIIPVAQGINYTGKPVTFKVGSAVAVQTSAWIGWGNELVNLIANSY
jgi:hypothetical protein